MFLQNQAIGNNYIFELKIASFVTCMTMSSPWDCTLLPFLLQYGLRFHSKCTVSRILKDHRDFLVLSEVKSKRVSPLYT